MGGLFPARGLLVALGGFSLGLFVALGGFSLGFLGGVGDASSGCFSFLGLLSFLPFFPLSLAFSRSAVQDADLGQINGEPTLCPISPGHRGLQPGIQAFYIESMLSPHLGLGGSVPMEPALVFPPAQTSTGAPHDTRFPTCPLGQSGSANLCWTCKVQR